MRKNRLLALLLAFALSLCVLSAQAGAASGLTAEFYGSAATGYTLVMNGIPSDCRGFQATIALKNGTGAVFVFDRELVNVPGIHCTYTATGTTLTVYAVSKHALTTGGTLRLGVLSAGSTFSVESVSGVKLLGADLAERNLSNPLISYPAGSAANKYQITAPTLSTGKLILSDKQAAAGMLVSIRTEPDAGYAVEFVAVSAADQTEVLVEQVTKELYRFEMPASAVTVHASFVKSDKTLPFRDVTEKAWYRDAVIYVYDNGLMNGTEVTVFDPDKRTTRAQVATIFYRLKGEPPVTATGNFPDVKKGIWYANAVRWAADNKLVTGYLDGTFAPDKNITREELAVLFWRYAGSPASASKTLPFTDAGKASGYALNALRWASENGIITGRLDGRLDPKGFATRAELATLLMRQKMAG